MLFGYNIQADEGHLINLTRKYAIFVRQSADIPPLMKYVEKVRILKNLRKSGKEKSRRTTTTNTHVRPHPLISLRSKTSYLSRAYDRKTFKL